MTEDILKNFKEFQRAVDSCLRDPVIIEIRHDLAEFTASQFLTTSAALDSDKASYNSVKTDEAISLILKIGGSLVSGANDLFRSGNAYAASALVRQLVEVEYLAWAFENDQREAAKWIASDKATRYKFFSPAKLRKAAEGKFRSKDYGYHCELGGHPVPGAASLLIKNNTTSQLMLSDMLGHAGRIWDHLIGWANANSERASVLDGRSVMLERYGYWKMKDLTTRMPPAP